MVDPSFPKWSNVIIPVFLSVVRPSVVCPSMAPFFNMSDCPYFFLIFEKYLWRVKTEGKLLFVLSLHTVIKMRWFLCNDFNNIYNFTKNISKKNIVLAVVRIVIWTGYTLGIKIKNIFSRNYINRGSSSKSVIFWILGYTMGSTVIAFVHLSAHLLAIGCVIVMRGNRGFFTESQN